MWFSFQKDAVVSSTSYKKGDIVCWTPESRIAKDLLRGKIIRAHKGHKKPILKQPPEGE